MNRLRSETRRSIEMELLARRTIRGWPNKRHDVDRRIQHYWQQRDDITVIDNLVFFKNRIIIPESMRKETIQSLHQGHLSNERMQQRASEIVYWPGIRQQVQQAAENCQKCSEEGRKNPRLPLMQSEEVQYPLQRVGIDVAHTGGEKWLIVNDEYSGLLTPIPIKNETSTEIIQEMRKWIAICGIPQKITTDNGTCFASKEFREWARNMKIEIQYSAPHHHRSNGLAESGVKRFKKLYEKNPENTVLAIIAENNAAKGNRPSPANLFYNREIRNGQVQIPSKLRENRKGIHEQWVETRRKERKQTERVYNRGTRNLKPIEINKAAMAYDHIKERWTKVWVTTQTSERNYTVILPSGHTVTRNRQDLKQPKYKVQFELEREEIPGGWYKPTRNPVQQEEEPEQPRAAPTNQEQQGSPPRRTGRQNAGRAPNRYGQWITK
jgi:transposase InsO family protein